MIDPDLIDMVMALRSRGISSSDVLRAFEQVPRRRFVPDRFRDLAYTDRHLPIECGQTLSAPVALAMMTQVAQIGREDKLLYIGLGSGYHAAVLSRLVPRVYAVERYKRLIAEAEAVYSANSIHNVTIRHGDGRYGWPGQAPFDRIILGCAVRAVPDSLLEQLAPNGKLVGSVDGQLCVISKARKHLTETTIMPLELDMIEAGKSKTL